jgi:hypothetical protein
MPLAVAMANYGRSLGEKLKGVRGMMKHFGGK